MGERDRRREELEGQEPAVLSEREAMSLIAPGPATEFIPDLDAVPDADPSPADEDDVPSEQS